MSSVVVSLLLGLVVGSPLVTTVDIQEEQSVEHIMEAYLMEEIDEEFYQDVMLTSYWTGDPTGTGSTTGSGRSTNEFEINELGWYTYKGDVVVASATNLCLSLQKGVCAVYNSLPGGYQSYDFYDKIEFEYDDQWYTGVVLDTCGACFWDEDYQRLDIYVSRETFSVGKKLSKIKKEDV